jgi:hypothetical protein
MLEGLSSTPVGFFRLPPKLIPVTLIRKPKSRHTPDFKGTFQCTPIEKVNLDNGKYDYILYYDLDNRIAYLFDSKLFHNKLYPRQYEIPGGTKTIWIGYVKKLIESNSYIECRYMNGRINHG